MCFRIFEGCFSFEWVVLSSEIIFRWAPTSYITPTSRVITLVIHVFSAICKGPITPCITRRGPPCMWLAWSDFNQTIFRQNLLRGTRHSPPRLCCKWYSTPFGCCLEGWKHNRWMDDAWMDGYFCSTQIRIWHDGLPNKLRNFIMFFWLYACYPRYF